MNKSKDKRERKITKIMDRSLLRIICLNQAETVRIIMEEIIGEDEPALGFWDLGQRPSESVEKALNRNQLRQELRFKLSSLIKKLEEEEI